MIEGLAVPGEPFEPSAAVWNGMRDAADRFARQQVRSASGGGASAELSPSVTCIIQNTSGAFADSGYILKVSGAQVDFPTRPQEARRRPTLTGIVPAAITDCVAILIDPAAPNAYARAVLLGEATCTVNVTDATHNFATPTVSDCTKLTSAAVGPIRLLDNNTGTGDKACMVLLQDFNEVGAWVKVTSETADANGDYPAVIRVANGSGVRSDGAVCRYRIQASTGEGVIANGVYWGTLCCISDVGGTKYTVLDGPGNDWIIREVCRDEATEYDRYDILHPCRVVENVDSETGEPL